MIRSKDKVLDDIAKVAGGGVSILSGLGQNIREDTKSRINDIADRLDLVPREDFETLEMRVKALEEHILATKTKTPKKK